MSQTSTQIVQNTGAYDPETAKTAMKNRGLSAEHLAILSGKSVTTVYLFLDGRCTKTNTMEDIVKALGSPGIKIDLGLTKPKVHRAIRSDVKPKSGAMQGRSTGGVGRS